MPFFSVDGLIGGSGGSLFHAVNVAFVGFFMLGWSVGVFMILVLFLGSIFGREVAYLEPGYLSVRLELFGAGFLRRFRGDDISGLHRFEPSAELTAELTTDLSSESAIKHTKGRSSPCLRFSYEDEVIEFGSGIDRRTAEVLIEEIEEVVLSQDAVAELKPVVNHAVPKPELVEKVATGSSLTSSISLVVANLVPLFGVLLFDWSVGDVMLLYWFESAVVGVYNLAKMWVLIRWGILLMGVFFVGHFGGFMAGHLFFIYALFVQGGDGSGSLLSFIGDILHLMPAVIALLISHGISFYVNFLGQHEFSESSVRLLMTGPYRRIIVMHLTLILGGFLSMALENPLPGLILMIVIKVGIDLRAHLREHEIPARVQSNVGN